MKIIIRKLLSSHNEYIAYLKPHALFHATVFAYFKDDIYGAVSLNRFIEMNRIYFNPDKIAIDYDETAPALKNKFVLDIIKNETGMDE